jgi:hypothetical protein
VEERFPFYSDLNPPSFDHILAQTRFLLDDPFPFPWATPPVQHHFVILVDHFAVGSLLQRSILPVLPPTTGPFESSEEHKRALQTVYEAVNEAERHSVQELVNSLRYLYSTADPKAFYTKTIDEVDIQAYDLPHLVLGRTHSFTHKSTTQIYHFPSYAQSEAFVRYNHQALSYYRPTVNLRKEQRRRAALTTFYVGYSPPNVGCYHWSQLFLPQNDNGWLIDRIRVSPNRPQEAVITTDS